MLPVKCYPEPNKDAELESDTRTSSSSSRVATYRWFAALGALGFMETGYLTYLKLTNSDAVCPISGGSCNDILNSDYAFVFGVPLPLIGMVAYGLVAALGLQLADRNIPFADESNGQLILLGITTSMAAASAYFLYIISTKFTGTFCSYCLISAMLSFCLFFLTFKDFRLQEMQKMVAVQLCIAGLVVAALSTSYSTAQPIGSDEVELAPFRIEVTTKSSPLALSLARHLHSIGAKMYGAFWCSHCLEQKQMFGREAAKFVDYVECFPDGYRKGITMAKACADAKIEGFPTWVINDQVLTGEQEFSELARASGFDIDSFIQPN